MCHMIIEALKCHVEVIWRFEVFGVNGVKKKLKFFGANKFNKVLGKKLSLVCNT